MDMLLHRLDLADARGQSIHIPDEWISMALGVAQAISADSPPRNPTSPAYSYAAPVPVPADATALDALVAALGRNSVSSTTTFVSLIAARRSISAAHERCQLGARIDAQLGESVADVGLYRVQR
jgi:hypothetical protein